MSRVSARSTPSRTSGGISLIKDGPNLAKDDDFSLGRKSEPSISTSGVGITQEIVEAGGLSITGGVSVDVSPLRVDISVDNDFEDPSKSTISVSGNAEIPGGFLGVSGGVTVNTSTGEITGGSIGGEVGGVGINVSNSQKGGLGIEFTLQIPGTPIELSLGFGFSKKDPTTPTTPTIPTTPTTPNIIPPPPQPETKHTPPGGISIESVKGCTLRIIWEETHFRKDPYASGCHTFYALNPPPSGGEWGLQSRDCKDEIWDFQGIWAMWDTSTRQNVRRYRDIIIENYFTQQNLDNILNYIYFYNIPSSFSVHNYREEDGADKNRVIIDARTVSEPSMIVHSCNSVKNPIIYTPSPPNKETPPKSKIQLPNYPQHFKRMDCCDKVEEIYKYLGIAKLKKNKFPVSNAFLVPGGSGNDNCFDYYAIMQALFRMLANGLIINPKSKPLGTEWQNVNATAWASGMYEMMAESMSDGNSTQRFEVAAMMQLVQIMSAVAENSRKTEFITDAIGIEPLPVPEELPVCFTIYESHKGFGKKELKKINTSNLKTDDDVEKVLGKMLNPSKIPIVAWKFKPGQISINEALKNG